MTEHRHGKRSKDSRKKERTPRRRNEVVSPLVAGGQEGPTSQGQGNGVQGHHFDDQGSSSGRNKHSDQEQRSKSSSGEVLEQLASIEQRFYRYVRHHQRELDRSKQESKEAEQEFKAEVDSLREKIDQLVKRTGVPVFDIDAENSKDSSS